MRWTWTRECGVARPAQRRDRVRDAAADRSWRGRVRPDDGARSGRRGFRTGPADPVARHDGPERCPGDGPDRGSAVVEFVGLGLLLLIPIMYLVVTVARVQAGSFAVVAAAEQAGQAVSVLESRELNRTGVHDVAAVAARDHGFAPEDLALTVSCSDGTCEAPGAVATVHAVVTVRLPGVPGFVTANVATLSSDVTVVSGRYS